MHKIHSARLRVFFSVILLFSSAGAIDAQQLTHFPEKNSWQTKAPAEAKFDAQKLKAAIEFAVASEAKNPRDQELGQAQTFGREPFGEAIGAFKPRGEMTGVILKNGFIVAEWGEPQRVDMTHSVTKSFITAAVGLAFDRGIIANLDAPVYKEMAPVLPYDPLERFDDARNFGRSKFLELFETEHNKKITWTNLLQQNSDWAGTLWGKPDWADRPDRDASSWLEPKRSEPGTVYEYNDVRVNLLALTALNVWRQPLPKVLKIHLMDEIGASDSWRWYGYENSFVVIDGEIIQSVSGGGHWGGGMFINARDLARFGLLIEQKGNWKGRRILSENFLKRAETPSRAQATYGFMNFFLNTEKKLYKNAPESAIAFLGNGTNIVFIDRENDLVIVARWIENNKIDEFLGKIYESLK